MSISEVAKATFYRHFPSKDDLVIAYLEYRDRSSLGYLDSPRPRKISMKPYQIRTGGKLARHHRLPVPSDRIRIPGFWPPVPSRGNRTRKQVSWLSHRSAKAFRNRQKSGGRGDTERHRWRPHHENALWNFEGDSDSLASRGSTQELSERANSTPQLIGCHYGSLIPSTLNGASVGSSCERASFMDASGLVPNRQLTHRQMRSRQVARIVGISDNGSGFVNTSRLLRTNHRDDVCNGE